jgi:hypothetical protein
MVTTIKQWEEAWSRLVEARENLKSFEPNHAIVRHILILDNIRPGDKVSLDYGLANRSLWLPKIRKATKSLEFWDSPP